MKRIGVLLAGALLGSCASVGGPAASPPAEGYLSETAVARLADGVAAPAFGTEALPEVGYDRLQLAIVHAELRPPEAAQHFDCALGVRFMAEPRPALTRLMGRLAADSGRVSEAAGRRAPRPRPPAAIAGLEPCQRINDAARESPSWPAGGAVAGAVYGEAFAVLVPERAEAVRRIGRELGASRAVCRMNWPSDVEAGQRLGLALAAELDRNPDYAADLAAARAEVEAARAEGLTNPGCAAERRALGIRPDAG